MLHILTTVRVAIDVRSTRVFVKSRKLAVASGGISMGGFNAVTRYATSMQVAEQVPQMCVASSFRSIHVAYCSISCTPTMTRNEILHLEQVASSGRIRKWLETSGVGPAIAGRNTAVAHAPGFLAPMEPQLCSSLMVIIMFIMWHLWPILSRGPNLSSLPVCLPRM